MFIFRLFHAWTPNDTHQFVSIGPNQTTVKCLLSLFLKSAIYLALRAPNLYVNDGIINKAFFKGAPNQSEINETT